MAWPSSSRPLRPWVACRSLTLAKFDLALAAHNGLQVLHLHGVVSDPATIVLTKSSYDAVVADERVQFLVRDLGIN